MNETTVTLTDKEKSEILGLLGSAARIVRDQSMENGVKPVLKDMYREDYQFLRDLMRKLENAST
jgi:hypothetical protein